MEHVFRVAGSSLAAVVMVGGAFVSVIITVLRPVYFLLKNQVTLRVSSSTAKRSAGNS